MIEKNVEQLWYTWSNFGLSSEPAGLRVRAASPGIRRIYETNPTVFSWYLTYALPVGISSQVTPADAPVSLAFLKTEQGYLLIHKVYVGLDGFGRPGNFFSHMLLPGPITARMAIELWNASLWQCQDVPLEQQRPESLSVLRENQLVQALVPPRFDFSLVEDVLEESIIAFLANNRQKQRLVLQGPSELVAAVIWGLTHSIPTALLPDLTFTTYDDDVPNSTATITGTLTAQDLANPTSQLIARFKQQRPSYAPAVPRLDADIAAFASFAVGCLKNTGSLNELEQLTSAVSYNTVQAFIQHFNEYKEQKNRPPVIPIPQPPPVNPPIKPQPAPGSVSPVNTGLPPLVLSANKPGPQVSAPADRQPPVTLSSANKPGPASTPADRQPGMPPARPITSKLVEQGGGKLRQLPRPALVVAAILLLLLLTNLSTFLITDHQVAASPARTPVVVQRPTSPANSTTQQSSGDAAQLLFTSSQQSTPSAKNKTSLTLYIALKNTGKNTWSAQNGYALVCVDPTDPDCHQTTISALNESVPPGGTYVFIIQLTAHFATPGVPDQGPHTIDLVMAHKTGTSSTKEFGSKYKLSYMVIS